MIDKSHVGDWPKQCGGACRDINRKTWRYDLARPKKEKSIPVFI